MDLSDVDVTDILALMDSLPYDELDVRTARFRLVLRRGLLQDHMSVGATDPERGHPRPPRPPRHRPRRCLGDQLYRSRRPVHVG